MNNFEMILFDLDGTLTDPKEGIVNSIQYALRKMNMRELTEVELLKFIGPPIQRSFKEICDMKDEDIEIAVHYYREYFTKDGMIENKVYEGIPNLLHELNESGKMVFVATSKPTVFAKQILTNFGLGHFFIDIIGSNLDGTRIDKKEIIEYISREYSQFSKKNTVMIGDRFHDVIGANQMDIESIGVTYGYGTKSELVHAGANYIVSNVEELSRLLLTESKSEI